MSKDDLVNANGIKCLDKLSTQKALSHLGEALDSIWQVVTDGCGSAAKSVHDIIQANEKHNEAIVQKDVWHKAKSLIKHYKNFLKTEKSDNEIENNITPEKMRTHFNYCCTQANGDSEYFSKLWLGAPKHWEDSKGLSDYAVEKLRNWMIKEHEDMKDYYTFNQATSLVEGFHRLATKYCGKDYAYAPDYCIFQFYFV